MAETDDSSLRAASPQRKESLWKRSKKILDANQITFLQPLLKNSEGGIFFICCHLWLVLVSASLPFFYEVPCVCFGQSRCSGVPSQCITIVILYFYSSLVKSVPLLGGRFHDR